MTAPIEHDAEILRAAIAWALHVADASDNPLVASFLADALHHAENSAFALAKPADAHRPCHYPGRDTRWVKRGF